jgi:hypothetical protein
VVYP